MAKWLRFEHGGKVGFGRLETDTVTVHQGAMCSAPRATGQKHA